MNKDCSILVSSCDAYSDVWDPFFLLFFKYWPDCPFSIYLASESKSYNHPRVHSILLGKDERWATNTKKTLLQIHSLAIIYLQEDYLLTKKVDTRRIYELVKILIDNRVGCIRLYPAPAPTGMWQQNTQLGVINKTDSYSISLQAAIWDKSFLESILIDGETGWDMEILGSKRIANESKLFLGVWDGHPALDYFCTAIKKGVWFRDAVWLLKREGILFVSKRKVESLKNYYLRITHIRPFLDRAKRISLVKTIHFLKKIFSRDMMAS